MTTDKRTTHGHTINGKSTKVYRSWQSMLFRVKDPRKNKNYGTVSICERWLVFENFLADMGEPPSPGHSLDRFPNKYGNYQPGNCRWADIFQQNRNKRNNILMEHHGEIKTLKEWADLLGRNYRTMRLDVAKGLTIADMLSKPVKPKTVPVLKCDLSTGVILKRYSKLTDVKKDGYSPGIISEHLSKGKWSGYGFKWKYDDNIGGIRQN